MDTNKHELKELKDYKMLAKDLADLHGFFELIYLSRSLRKTQRKGKEKNGELFYSLWNFVLVMVKCNPLY